MSRASEPVDGAAAARLAKPGLGAAAARLAAPGLAAALVAGAALVLLAIAVGLTDGLDAAVGEAFRRRGSVAGREVASELVQIGNLREALALCAATAAAALITCRPAVLAGVLTVLLGANLTGLALEPFFHRQVHVGPQAFTYGGYGSAPSNHLLLVGSVVGAGVLAVPARWLAPWLAGGAAALVAMALALLALESHLVSDLVAAALLAAAWSALGALVLAWCSGRLPARAGPLPVRRGQLAVVLGAGAAVGLVLLARSHHGLATPGDLHALPLPVAAVLLAAGATWGAVAAAQRRA